MQLARVIGTVVATIKSPGLEGVKLLIIQPLDRAKEPSGAPVVAADAVHMAGPGELVYFVAAREASQALEQTFVPVDHAIVGIVDAVEAIASGSAGGVRSREPAPGPAEGARGDRPAEGSRPAAGAGGPRSARGPRSPRRRGATRGGGGA